MRRVCTGSVADVLELYTKNAVLIPTFDKSDLPGAGSGVLVGREYIAGYFRRFMAKPNLCGAIDTTIAQPLIGATVYSGLYTFAWDGYVFRSSASARYTFVVVAGELAVDGRIATHHSSQLPGRT